MFVFLGYFKNWSFKGRGVKWKLTDSLKSEWGYLEPSKNLQIDQLT